MLKQIFNKNRLLLSLLIAVFFKQLVWIAFVPIWHFPDEQAHFGQVAYNVEIDQKLSGNNLNQEILISERILQTDRDWAGNNKFTYHPEYNIPYTNSLIGRHEEEIKNLPSDSRKVLVKLESTSYPPLYYLFANFIYRLFYNTDLFIRVFLLRVINIIYALLTVYIAYKLFFLIFGSSLLTLIGTILVSFQPMFSFTQGGINSDNLFNLLFTWAIFICLSSIKKGLKIKEVVLSMIIFFLAVYTKPQGYLVILIYLYPPFYHLLKNKKFCETRILLFSLIFFSPILLTIFKEKLWLPEINLLEIKNLALKENLWWSFKHTYREVLPWYWGVFRWLSLAMPKMVNKIINRILLILGIGLILHLARIIKEKDFSFKTITLGFFFYASFVYYGIITFWDCLFKVTHGFSFGIQGRYFLPVLSVHMGILIFGFLGFTLKERVQKVLAFILATGMIILHEIALFRVLLSYFSNENMFEFFLQASQYKPWFFKAPFLQFILIIHLISLIILLFNLTKISLSYEKS